jgi:hypothetical protein
MQTLLMFHLDLELVTKLGPGIRLTFVDNI